MEDDTAQFRRKGRFIVEIRYPAVPRLFDIRGRILRNLHPQLEGEFPNWRTNKGKIHFVDDLEDPTAEFWFTHMRAAVILEEPVEIDRFLERADRYLPMMYDALEGDITELNRCGVRLIEILSSEGVGSYESVNNRVVNRFFQDLPGEDLTYVDSMMKAVHEHGSFQVGPAGVGENWVSGSFSQPNEDVPEFGFGVDVDSNRKEIEIHGGEELIEAYRAVAEVTKNVEEAVAEQVGLL